MGTPLDQHLNWPPVHAPGPEARVARGTPLGIRHTAATGTRAPHPTTRTATDPQARSTGRRDLASGVARTPTAAGVTARGLARGLRRLARGRTHVVPPFRAAKGPQAF